MKYLLLLLPLILVSCSTTPTETQQAIDYPEDLRQVFEAHGGLAKWQKMNALTYELEKGAVDELQKIDLKSRKEYIKGKDFEMAFDGENIWLKADSTYTGSPWFYKNLMFYFYAMPFVLADDGIIYKEVSPLIFEGESYHGILIAYEDGVGVSSKDEYVLYYHPETYQMEWLAYTVTYKSQEKSDNFKYIRYTDWGDFEGLRLPKTLTWYHVEDGIPTAPRNTRVFQNIKLTDIPFEENVFERFDGAEAVER